MAPESHTPGRADDLDDLAGSIRLSVFRLGRMLRQHDSHELSVGLTTALLTIGRYGPMSLSTLAANERVSAPSASKIVEKLVERGSVVREANERDRRGVRISVTPAGAAEIELIRCRRTAVLRSAIDSLPDEQRDLLPDVVAVLEALIDAAARGDGDPGSASNEVPDEEQR